MPYIFYLSSLIFIVIAAFHLKHLREKDLQDQIVLQELQINEDYSHYGDTDVLNELNTLEGGSTGPTTPKK